MIRIVFLDEPLTVRLVLSSLAILGGVALVTPENNMRMAHGEIKEPGELAFVQTSSPST
jgi:hypothetical protein